MGSEIGGDLLWPGSAFGNFLPHLNQQSKRNRKPPIEAIERIPNYPV